VVIYFSSSLAILYYLFTVYFYIMVTVIWCMCRGKRWWRRGWRWFAHWSADEAQYSPVPNASQDLVYTSKLVLQMGP